MRRIFSSAVLAALAAAGTSCGDAVTQSTSPMLLVVNSLEGAPTHGTTTFSGNLVSDVVVLVTTPPPCSPTAPCPTVFADVGRVVLASHPKNITVQPTSNNQITITRYHVDYIRADGHNTPGVDVPFPFDGAVTGTIPEAGTLSLTFELVRTTAKAESPLAQLASNPNVLHTIARVTFYGQDIVGNAISVTGSMNVDFGNFGDQ